MKRTEKTKGYWELIDTTEKVMIVFLTVTFIFLIYLVVT